MTGIFNELPFRTVVHLIVEYFTMIGLYMDIYLTENEAIVVWRQLTIPSILDSVHSSHRLNCNL